MALFLQVSSSLAPMQVYWRMLHCPAAKPGVATGLLERGLLSTAQVQFGKNGVFNGFILLDYIYLYVLLLCYTAIYLYIYIVIALFIYCVVCLLLYCMLEAWEYCFLYIYILFLFLTSTSIFYDSGCRLSIIWLFTVQRYGGSVRYQTPGDALFG